MTPPRLVATCWTSAGDVTPRHSPQLSPLPIADRIAAVAATGWWGMGLCHDDLVDVRATIGFGGLRQMIEAAGLRHVEVELIEDWASGPAAKTDLLLEAAVALDAAFVKVGPDLGEPLDSMDPLVGPLRRLAERAGEHGVRIALEPLPFSTVGSIPAGADLVRAVDHPACGLVVDAWHVFRAGTSLEELRSSLSADVVFGVELNDAAPDVVGTLFEDTVNNRHYCGEGVFDLPGLVRVLRDVGFDGPWGVEILSAAHRAASLTDALRSAFETAVEVCDAATTASTMPA